MKRHGVPVLLFLLLGICCTPILSGGEKELSFINGSLLFHTRNEQYLDDAIMSGLPRSVAEIRQVTGLSLDELQSMTSLVEGLGGIVDFTSSFHDWMYIKIPKSLMARGPSKPPEPCSFLSESLSLLDDSHSAASHLLHHMATALQEAELVELVSGMIIDSNVTKGDLANARTEANASNTRYDSTGRHILQDKNTGNAVIFVQPSSINLDYAWKYMWTDSESTAANGWPSWRSMELFFVQCDSPEGSYLSSLDTENCLDGYEFTLTPLNKSKESKTWRFDGTSDLKRKTCEQLPESFCEEAMQQIKGGPSPTNTTFVYGIVLKEYAEVGEVYENVYPSMMFSLSGEKKQPANIPSSQPPGKIFNTFNANGVTLRDFYGVLPDVKGTQETLQSTTLEIGAGAAAINITAQNEYLGWFELGPHRQLVIDSSLGFANNLTYACDRPKESTNLLKQPNNDCGEASLDVLALQSMAPNATTVFYPTQRSRGFKSDWLRTWMEWFDKFEAQKNRPDILSLSWTDDYDVMGPYYETLENRLKKTVALGITILVSSGDGGASGQGGEGDCYPPANPLIGNYPNETWPTGSPWVTGVGGTMIQRVGSDLQEVVISKVFDGGVTSGGGFTGKWLNITTPAWQRASVERYLRENNQSTFSAFPTMDTPGFNPQGRGFPDISLYADNFPAIKNPYVGTASLLIESGTSLSAPLMAGMFTLANQRLLSQGYRKIGYANPMLYWMGDNCKEAFNDITMGNNQWSTTQKCLYGFPAAPGWDPATGLGTINFEPFVECAMKWQDGPGKSLSGTPSAAAASADEVVDAQSAGVMATMMTMSVLVLVSRQALTL